MGDRDSEGDANCPQLPSAKPNPDDDNNDKKEAEGDLMPALPPHMKKTGTPTTTTSAKEDQNQQDPGGKTSEDESEEYCPALPPHMLQGGNRKSAPPPRSNERRSVVGPMLPKGFIPPTEDTHKEESTDEEEEEEEEKPVVGPVPSAEKVDPGEYRARELEERARRMRDKLEGRDKVSDKPMKRESWMTELPEDKPNFCGLGARQFLRKTPAEKGDRSIWTDTPADRAKKAKDQEEQQQEKEEEGTIEDDVIRQRDKDLTKKVDEYNKTKRAKPLVDLHRIELKRKQKDEGPKERRPFSREEDLSVNKFDEAQKSNIMKKARQLNDRFSSGKAKFL